MTTKFPYDVFLSHNSKDKVRVRQLAERLRAASVRVWFDEWIIKAGDDIYLTIERGLQDARVQILCLSPTALTSDWVGLERSTVLFRDPANASRRFIPLLLLDCDLPDTLRRYKYVDFRQETDAAFAELLAACQPEAEGPSPAPPPQPAEKIKPAKTAQPAKLPDSPAPLAVLERKLTGHTRWVNSVAVSPDGTWAASGSWDKTVKLWDLATGECRATLEGHTEQVRCVAITPDGQRVLSGSIDNTIRVWDAKGGPALASWQASTYYVNSLVVLSDGRRVLSGEGGSEPIIKLWEIETHKCIAILKGHNNAVSSVALTRDEKKALSSSSDKTLKLWDLVTGECLVTLQGHSDHVHSVKSTPDGQYAVSGSNDKTVKIWELATGVCVGTLEGHQAGVNSVAISPDGVLIASSSTDKPARLWDWQSGACLQEIEYEGRTTPSFVTFSPDGLRLVTGTFKGNIYVYRLTRVGATPLSELTRRYVNAKVVLVGESGVGKSGLAHRLIDDQFVPTYSTHGMNVWRLDLPEAHPDPRPSETGVVIEREALLWDLAGQEDYRLIHQLFLDETALALLLFNPQSQDPFSEVGVWLKVLRAAVPQEQARTVAKLLIAARVDVGNVKVSQRKIDQFVKAYGLAGYLPTSALRGDNCSDAQNGGQPSVLKQLIAEHIPWDKLPWTSTPRLLAELKNALVTLTEQKAIRLLRFAELTQRLEQALPQETFGAADVRTAVTLLANHGLVMPLQFGDLVLLRPELLNGYASAVIRAARDHIDEIGCVAEQAVFARTLDLAGVERLEAADEELLMRALVQTLLDKSLCIAEETPEGRHLIFPSQYRREREIPAHPEIFVSYTFSGEWQTVYTTLVVRLWYSREFQHRELWRNAAEFETSKGRVAGLLMARTGEGEGTLSVFFDLAVPDELKVIFIEYVHRHLARYARDVQRDRRYVCANPKCKKPVTDLGAVRERLAAQKDFITCQHCDKKVPLIDHIEQRLASDPVARRVLGMDQRATQELDAEALAQILTGHLMAICGEANQIFRLNSSPVNGIDGEIEFKNNQGAPSGQKIYVQLKSGSAHRRTRQPDGQEIVELSNAQHLAAWVRQPVDVYLVIRQQAETGSDATIRWMNVTRYLKAQRNQASQQLLFAGEKLDAPAVWRVRDHFFSR